MLHQNCLFRRTTCLSKVLAPCHVIARFISVQHNALDTSCTARPLSGRIIGIKDNIASSSHSTTAASKSLSNHVSPFEATVVALLRGYGAEILPGLNMDEFGMGSHSQNSHFGPVSGPFSRAGVPLSAGGSSGGSAVAVANGSCWAAVGTDTGGSVRLPAAYNGVLGFKPSYGLLSRWGVIQYANSLDTVGILGRNVKDVGAVFRMLNVYDAQDPSSLLPSLRQRLSSRAQGSSSSDTRGLRIGIPLQYNLSERSPTVHKAYTTLLKALQLQGHALQQVDLPTTQLSLSAYYVLAPAEASSNLSKYDGIRYGHRPLGPDANPHSSPPSPLYVATRSSSFGPEVQRRILLGTYSLSSNAMDNYFVQAQKVRRMVQQDFDSCFVTTNPLLVDDDNSSRRSFSQANQTRAPEKVDILLTPTAPTLPPTIEDVKAQTPVQNFMNDIFTVPASLAGLPSISVPVALGALAREQAGLDAADVDSVGMQVIGQFGDDERVLQVAELVEEFSRTVS